MLTQEIQIINKLGLHARASSKLVNLASKFKSKITITCNNSQANAKSIMAVMMLAASYGSKIMITAHGEDELLAMQELTELINHKFGED